MGAKLSRRKSESAAGADGVAAESPTTEQPETAEVITATENDEQKPDAGDAEVEAEPKPTEVSPEVDEAPSEPASEPGPLETVTQAVEKIVSNVSEQIAGPVEDIVNKGLGAVEAMMAAVSVKDDPAEEVAAPAPEAKDEPMVDILVEAAPKIDFSIPEPPEESEQLPSEPSTMEDLLLSQPIPECLLREPVPTAVVKDVTIEAEKNLGLPIQIETQAPLEIEESLVCVKQDAEPAEPPLNCDMGADPTPLNSDPLVDLGDMEQAMSTAVSTVIDLI